MESPWMSSDAEPMKWRRGRGVWFDFMWRILKRCETNSYGRKL